jgi:hypothetical protein
VAEIITALYTVADSACVSARHTKLAAWSRLPAGTPDAVDQLRQQLQAMGIDLNDRRAVRLAGRSLALADELHSGIGDEPEYIKRARLNFVLSRLCSHLEAGMVAEIVAAHPE